MTDTAEVLSLASIAEVQGHIRRAQNGHPMVYRENGEDAAVLIPISAFRAVQKLFLVVMKDLPLNCWDDPIVTVSFPIEGHPDELRIK